MSFFDAIRHRLRPLISRRNFDREMDDEFQHHLELHAQEFPEGEAPTAWANARFGRTAYYKEETRRMTSLGWLDVLRQDLKYGMRQLMRAPAFTAVAVLSLAIGIGANSAIFSLIYSLLLNPLALPHAEQLVEVQHTWRVRPNDVFSYEDYQALRKSAGFVSVTALGGTGHVPFVAGDFRNAVDVDAVDGNYFSALGVRPLRGRLIGPDDERTHAPVVVISEALWTLAFNRAPSAVGERDPAARLAVHHRGRGAELVSGNHVHGVVHDGGTAERAAGRGRSLGGDVGCECPHGADRGAGGGPHRRAAGVEDRGCDLRVVLLGDGSDAGTRRAARAGRCDGDEHRARHHVTQVGHSLAAHAVAAAVDGRRGDRAAGGVREHRHAAARAGVGAGAGDRGSPLARGVAPAAGRADARGEQRAGDAGRRRRTGDGRLGAARAGERHARADRGSRGDQVQRTHPRLHRRRDSRFRAPVRRRAGVARRAHRSDGAAQGGRAGFRATGRVARSECRGGAARDCTRADQRRGAVRGHAPRSGAP